jgi:hypothetical protein
MHDGAVISVAQQVLLQNHSRFQPHATHGNSYVIYYSSAVAFNTAYLHQTTCVFFRGVTTHCGCIFHSPVADFSLLVFEVS